MRIILKLIPAIDLKDGCVVHARGGDRRHYRRLKLPLFPNAQPVDVIARLLDGAAPGPPDTVYLADLDAIAGEDGNAGKNRSAVAEIRHRFPALRVWLDTGVRRRRDIGEPEGGGQLLPVVGTETLVDDISLFNDIDYILSLDFDAKHPPGGSLLQHPETWPHTVIALMLDRVGAQCGPDVARLKPLRARHRGRLIAGGGVRDERDLRELQACGMDGALAATAIYHGRLRGAGGHVKCI